MRKRSIAQQLTRSVPKKTIYTRDTGRKRVYYVDGYIFKGVKSESLDQPSKPGQQGEPTEKIHIDRSNLLSHIRAKTKEKSDE